MTDKQPPRIVTARKPKAGSSAAAPRSQPVATVVEARSPAQIAKAKRIQKLRDQGYRP
jgi:hypothetical protein